MRTRYWQALIVATVGVAIVIWAGATNGDVSNLALIFGSAAIPAAALLMVSGRLEEHPPLPSVVGGGTVGVGIALLSHAVVLAFAYAFFLGFAEEAASLLDLFRADPQWTSLLSSPWTIFLLMEVAIVAPFTEEIGKAIGSRFFKPTSRQTAFLAGVAAGTGFAIVENIAYASGGWFFGGSWEAIVIGRMMGAAVHPLASGLVVMGWWEYRQNRDFGHLAQRFFSGVGVHALWNGSLVVLGVSATAFDSGTSFGDITLVSLTYSAALGAVAAAALWRTTASVAKDESRLLTADSGDGRVVGAWTVLAATFLVPTAMLILAFPAFFGGG